MLLTTHMYCHSICVLLLLVLTVQPTIAEDRFQGMYMYLAS